MCHYACSNVGLGKFSQSHLKSGVKLIYSYTDFVKIRHGRPDLNIKSICPLSEDMAEVTTEIKDEFSGFHKNTHVSIT